jgi:hypothetical protein
MKKDLVTETTTSEQERPEPFATVLELADRHGKLEVLEALTNLAEFDSEDPNLSEDDREADAILYSDLSMALEQYSLFSQWPTAQVNHEAVAI